MITLFKDEKIILIQRRHWLPFIIEIIFLIIIAILPFFIFIFLEILPPQINQIIITYLNYYFFFSFALVLILWIASMIIWTNYYLDILILTNKRIIDIEQIGLFARDEAEIRYENVEDIKIEVIGIIASVFKFGNIHIQSAGESREIIIKNIPHPEKIKEIISFQKEEVHRKNN